MFPPTYECSGLCVPLTCFPFNDVMLLLWHRSLLSFSIFYLHNQGFCMLTLRTITYKKQNNRRNNWPLDMNTHRKNSRDAPSLISEEELKEGRKMSKDLEINRNVTQITIDSQMQPWYQCTVAHSWKIPKIQSLNRVSLLHWKKLGNLKKLKKGKETLSTARLLSMKLDQAQSSWFRSTSNKRDSECIRVQHKIRPQ